MAKQITARCPRCGSKVIWDEKSTHRPFCSKRCHLIDLGAWLNEEHSIPGEAETSSPQESRSSDKN